MKTTLTTTCFAALFACAALHAETAEKDPLKNGETIPAVTLAEDSPNISVRYESFSLSLTDAAALQRENPGDSQLYSKLIAMLANKSAKQESLMIVRTQSGQKATAESILERIYPTEFEAPRLPDALGVSVGPRKIKDDNADANKPAPKIPVSPPDTTNLGDAPSTSSLAGLATPATPTAFETRNTGDTLEIEPTWSADARKIDLRLVPERVTFVGTTHYGQGLSLVDMPEYESQRMNTSASVQPGKPYLLGTVSRPPASKVDADSANRIWFAFVTADLAKP